MIHYSLQIEIKQSPKEKDMSFFESIVGADTAYSSGGSDFGWEFFNAEEFYKALKAIKKEWQKDAETDWSAICAGYDEDLIDNDDNIPQYIFQADKWYLDESKFDEDGDIINGKEVTDKFIESLLPEEYR